ncbi:MAG: hypothetical protein F6K48_11350 [Okeania sp. SIO3H1]|uniref:hypothetical protein n=1 Tax=Okeania sp. SIO1I7 TaxID=2607772 RepID=UPI0013CBEA8A|nr:hypothetical protein [Okeania sp. SIO1I7]NEN89458.1 hypothetical protein [Okeania sp. SIO3H1]NET27061.1 hypothetical protein [Okeania sp. SIO1I7]
MKQTISKSCETPKRLAFLLYLGRLQNRTPSPRRRQKLEQSATRSHLSSKPSTPWYSRKQTRNKSCAASKRLAFLLYLGRLQNRTPSPRRRQKLEQSATRSHLSSKPSDLEAKASPILTLHYYFMS